MSWLPFTPCEPIQNFIPTATFLMRKRLAGLFSVWAICAAFLTGYYSKAAQRCGIHHLPWRRLGY